MALPRHSLCDRCYRELEPGRAYPVRVTPPQTEICCHCGKLTTSGIYYRQPEPTYSWPFCKCER